VNIKDFFTLKVSNFSIRFNIDRKKLPYITSRADAYIKKNEIIKSMLLLEQDNVISNKFFLYSFKEKANKKFINECINGKWGRQEYLKLYSPENLIENYAIVTIDCSWQKLPEPIICDIIEIAEKNGLTAEEIFFAICIGVLECESKKKKAINIQVDDELYFNLENKANERQLGLSSHIRTILIDNVMLHNKMDQTFALARANSQKTASEVLMEAFKEMLRKEKTLEEKS